MIKTTPMECMLCEPEPFRITFNAEENDIVYCPFCGEKLQHELELNDDWCNDEHNWDEVEDEWDDK